MPFQTEHDAMIDESYTSSLEEQLAAPSAHRRGAELLAAADAMLGWAERDWREDHAEICGCDTPNDSECQFGEAPEVETYRRLRGDGATARWVEPSQERCRLPEHDVVR